MSSGKINNRILIVFLGLMSIVYHQASGQAGYIGKRNEISFDIFNAAVFNNYMFTYKFAANKEELIFITAGKCNATKEMRAEELDYLTFDATAGRVETEFSTYGLGVMFNSGIRNMQMPVGYYKGTVFQYNTGTQKEIFDVTDNTLSNQKVIKYDYSQFTWSFLYGKNTIITSMLSLDISLSVGVSRVVMTWLETTPTDPNFMFEEPEEPYAEYPNSFPGFQKRDFTSDYTSKFVGYRFVLMPSIRVGYIF